MLRASDHHNPKVCQSVIFFILVVWHVILHHAFSLVDNVTLWRRHYCVILFHPHKKIFCLKTIFLKIICFQHILPKMDEGSFLFAMLIYFYYFFASFFWLLQLTIPNSSVQCFWFFLLLKNGFRIWLFSLTIYLCLAYFMKLLKCLC